MCLTYASLNALPCLNFSLSGFPRENILGCFFMHALTVFFSCCYVVNKFQSKLGIPFFPSYLCCFAQGFSSQIGLSRCL